MIIGVDAGCLCVDDDRLKTGVYTVAVNLLKQLIQLDSNTRYLFYCFSPIDSTTWKHISGGKENMMMKVTAPKNFWMTVSLSKELLLHPVDVFLGFGQALPFIHPKRSLVFCYDCAFERFPQYYPGTADRLSRQTRHAMRNADRVLSISAATKSDVTKYYHVPSSRIHVINLGIDTDLFTASRKKRNDREYFLYVGSLKPIKNIPRLIEAFIRFRKTANKDYQLVIAGSDWWLDTDIRDTIQQYNKGDVVRQLGYVPAKQLPRLYANATAFVSLGLQEGFGLPYLEAMACGCPVIGANTGAAPEVIGDAGITVDPMNVDQIVVAMKQITDEKRRNDMIRRGLARTKLFSWEKSAEQVLQILHTI